MLCLLCASISQACDIVEHLLVLTELREGGHDWYENNTVDGLGDIFLMYSLYLFAQLWCENVHLLIDKSSTPMAESLGRDLHVVKTLYRNITIATVPLALLFSNAGLLKHYDQLMVLYVCWGVFTGLLVLTPVALLMYRIVDSLRDDVSQQQKRLYSELCLMAKINLVEQLVWNMLIIIALGSFMMFFHGGNKSAAMIGLASISISVAWMVMHMQIVLFFITVAKASKDHVHSPLFEEEVLLQYSLLEADTIVSPTEGDIVVDA